MVGYERGDAKSWSDSKLHMRLAQGSAIPQTVADNPIEFGEIHEELERRQNKKQLCLVLSAAAVGAMGSIVGGGLGALLTIALTAK